MSSDHVERRLTAILAADVAGYSRLMSAAEEDTLARLKIARKKLLDPKIAEHRGATSSRLLEMVCWSNALVTPLRLAGLTVRSLFILLERRLLALSDIRTVLEYVRY